MLVNRTESATVKIQTKSKEHMQHLFCSQFNQCEPSISFLALLLEADALKLASDRFSLSNEPNKATTKWQILQLSFNV